MPGPPLATKLHVPRPRRALVERPRLTARLDDALQATLTVVSAPAGFGKTTLVASWARATTAPTAWLSLDPRDDDPVSFWSYVLAALRTAAPGLGDDAIATLHDERSSVQVALESLLNELSALPSDLVLVLDDLHLVESREVHEQLAFVLDHLPPHVHVVVATRVDPLLPVARLRARGELVEVRAADLRFTIEESTDYLTGAMGLAVTGTDVAALDDRTEGWIAALQLAALSVRGRDDVADFIRGFHGDDRYVVDYLVEEVLQRQPVEVRDFLLQTSVLDRFSADLCDAVTGRDDGPAVLASLDRQNLFVVPLDDSRRWYRYHHLFAEVLRSHLVAERADLVPHLHARASAWFERQGDLDEAVSHALAAGGAERAADLVERAMPELRRGRRDATLRRWLQALPVAVVHARPELTLGLVAGVIVHGDLDGVEEHLRAVERWLADNASAEGAGAVARSVALFRSGQARITGDLEGSMRHARHLLELAGDAHPVEEGGAAALLGLALWESGELAAAADHYARAVRCFERAGHLPDRLGCTVGLADIARARGLLEEATAAYERALDAAERAPTVPRGTVDLHVGLAELLLDRGEHDEARAHLDAARALGDAAGLPQSPYRQRVARAQLSVLDGDVDGALALLDEAARLCDNDFSPDVRPVAAVRARVLVAAGRLDDAAAWAAGRGVTTQEPVTYLREFEHLTLARLLLARRGAGEAVPELDPFLDRLLDAAEAGGRRGSAADVLVLLSLAARGRHDRAAAAELLARAVDLAAPQRLAAPFLEHGAALAEPLRAVARSAPFARRLVAQQTSLPPQRGVVDPLSARELEVLRLLGTDLDGPGIARHLVVSLNTVRTHTKSIYAKLGVTSRRQAVSVARRLDLLPG